MASLLRPLALLALVPLACSWTSISQALYGVELDGLRQASYQQSSANADGSIGYLWSAGRSLTDKRGLGHSITWAWDPLLCDKLLPAFSSSAMGVTLVDCNTIRVSMHRAFSTWSQNHPLIYFTEVTDLCERAGTLNEDCPYAEVWVTYRNSTRDGTSAGLTPGALQAAVALPTVRTTNDFVFTNGQSPTLAITVGANTLNVQKQMIEIVSGRMEFEYVNPLCWYVDSEFCNGFHRFKRNFGDPAAANAVIAILVFVFWGFAAIAMVLEILCAFRSQLKMKKVLFVDTDNDGEIEAHEIAAQAFENAKARVEAFLAAIAHESIIGTAVRFCILLVPVPFYIYVFLPCWDCYDFEAAAAHEIGHLLGLGHPDIPIGAELASPSYQPTNSTFYRIIADNATEMLTATDCLHPWNEARPGVPPDFPAADLTGSRGPLVRPSIMESFTTHNPAVCLQQDDYEGLLTLYPVCGGVPPTPRCDKADRNIGLLRVAAFIFVPLIIALVVSIFLHIFVEREAKKMAKKKEARLQNRRASGKNVIAGVDLQKTSKVAPSRPPP